MPEQSTLANQKSYESAPSSHQVIRFILASAIGAALLFSSGLALTGTVLSLIIATPVLVLFSPILVPAGILVLLATTGFLFSGGCSVTAFVALSWMYNYVAGKHPLGADRLDYARTRIADKARDMKDRAREYAQHAEHKAQEGARGS